MALMIRGMSDRDRQRTAHYSGGADDAALEIISGLLEIGASHASQSGSLAEGAA
jgi:hypothetical protein